MKQRRRDFDGVSASHGYGGRKTGATTAKNNNSNNKNLFRGKQKTDDDRMTCTSGIVPRAKIKTIKMTFVFVTTFILCYCPYFVFDLLDIFGMITHDRGRRLASFIQCLAPLNSAVNPIVYSIFNPKVLDSFKNNRLCSSLCRCFQYCCKWCSRGDAQPGSKEGSGKRYNSTYGGVCTETIVLGESIRRHTSTNSRHSVNSRHSLNSNRNSKKELALVVNYSSGTPTSSGSAVGRHQQHHPPASPEIGTPDVKGDRDNSSLPGVNNGPQQGGVGGINVIRASGIRVIRESPSSSGDFTAKLNQIPVNPFPSSQYLLAVPKDDEPV